jgi:4-amino-4-deoxy-L-arabinose transferase-like glycosyltransferase
MPQPPAPRPLREHWPAAVLGVAAALVALWARHRLFPALSWNRDEPVYLWHVDVLRSGRLTAPDGGYPELFHPWLSAHRGGELFAQYTLGWPLVLLASTVLTGTATAALLLGAALAVVGTYAFGYETFGSRRVATVGATLLVASPILPIQGGVHLSYLFTLGLGLSYGALFLSGVRRGRPWRLLASGLLVGWIFLTRPYDAVLWAVAFSVAALLHDRRHRRAVLRAISVTGAAALPFVLVALAYNRRVTGGWLEFPITTADPLDTFGFGRKRLMPTFEVTDYGPGTALRATAKNAVLLPWFLVGTYVGLGLAALGLWQRRREGAIGALLVALVFPLGYFVFWGTHLSSLAARISGPIYLIPLYAPLCLLAASALVSLWDRRRRLAHVALVLLIVATVPAAATRFDVNHDISAQQAAWRASVDGVATPALVIVADTAPYLLYLNPFSSNGPDLGDDVLYASDASASVLDLIAERPDRTVYVQGASIASQELGPREDVEDLEVSLTPATVVRAPSVRLEVTVAPTVVEGASLGISGDAGARAIDLDGADGGRTTIVLVPSGAGGPQDVEVAGRGTLLVTLRAPARDLVRHRIHYRVVGGDVEVLTPTFVQRFGRTDDREEWRHVPSAAELRIEGRPAPG